MPTFPSNPSIGTTTTIGGREHTYNGTGWYYSGGRKLSEIDDTDLRTVNSNDKLLFNDATVDKWYNFGDSRADIFTKSTLSSGTDMSSTIQFPTGTSNIPTIDGFYCQYGSPGGVGFLAFGRFLGIDMNVGKEYTDGLVFKLPVGFNTFWLRMRFEAATYYSYAFSVAYKETSSSPFEYIGMYKATKSNVSTKGFTGLTPDGFSKYTFDKGTWTIDIPITHGKTNGGLLFIGSKGSMDGYTTPSSAFMCGYSFSTNAFNMSYTGWNSLLHPGYNLGLANLLSIGTTPTVNADWDYKGRINIPAGGTTTFPILYTRTGKDRMVVLDIRNDGIDGLPPGGFYINGSQVPSSAIRTTRDWFSVGMLSTRIDGPFNRLIQIRVPVYRLEAFYDRAFTLTVDNSLSVDNEYQISGVYVYDIPYDSRNQW